MPGSEPFQDILYPTDFSKASEAIASHVAGMAKAFGASVRLLNVVPSLTDVLGAYPLSEAGIIAREQSRWAPEAEAKRKLEDLQKLHFDSATSEIHVETGGVAESIVDCSKDMKAGLIMMSTRGLGVMRRFLIGPVTAKVLHDATCSVWTSPHPRELDPFRPYRHVILALDYRGWPAGLPAHAARIADAFHARLSVLSALPRQGVGGDEAAPGHPREMADRLLEQIRKLNLDARAHVMEGEPGEAVRHLAEQVGDADLIATGRGRLDESMGHLRTHAYEIIWNAPCPVMTLPG